MAEVPTVFANKLIAFPGISSPGAIPILGADPGDEILSVINLAADGNEYVGDFLRVLQYNPAAASGQAYAMVIQTSRLDLSAIKFLALLKKGPGVV
jgi:hypothetical protein